MKNGVVARNVLADYYLTNWRILLTKQIHKSATLYKLGKRSSDL